MPETHIVRFKVVKVECPIFKAGMRYTITYRRGTTMSTTPCAKADAGVVNFSSAPEGAAVVHFRRGGVRFAPKYINFRIEEFTESRTRLTLGDVDVDCSDVLGLHNHFGRAVKQANFVLGATRAVITVAIIAYPDNGVPLSFDGLIPDSATAASTTSASTRTAVKNNSVTGGGSVKQLTRGEAMTLLISLETLSERKRSNSSGTVASEENHPLLRRIAELEEKRRSFASLDGLAKEAIRERSEGIVSAQFLALSRRYRNNYTAEVASYLRQMAINSGLPIDMSLEALTVDPEEARAKLQRTNARIESLQKDLQALMRGQLELAKHEQERDVTEELCASLQKVETVQAQIKLLEQARESCEKTIRGEDAATNNPLAQEVTEIQQHIRELRKKQESLQKEADSMSEKAASIALMWARSKNPPPEEVSKSPKKAIEDLFSGVPAPGATTTTTTAGGGGAAPAANGGDSNENRPLGATDRTAIIEALKRARDAAAAKAAQEKAEKELQEKQARDRMELEKLGLPSAMDFTDQKAAPAAGHTDPFAPDLRKDMFAPEQPKPAAAPAPASNQFPSFDFSSANNRQTNDATGGGFPSFNFGSDSVDNRQQPGTTLTQGGQPQQQQQSMFTIEAMGQGSSDDSPPMQPSAPPNDSFDYTPAQQAGGGGLYGGGAAIEITGGDLSFDFGGNDGGANSSQQPSTVVGSGSSAQRPTFDFGPSDSAAPASQGSYTKPVFNFGNTDDSSGKTGNGGGYGEFSSGFPTYNFGA